MVRYALLLMLMVAAASGCWPSGSSPAAVEPIPVSELPASARKNGAKTPDPKRYVLLVRIRLVTIEVPMGTVSGSETVWNYLDEESIGRKKLVTLSRNGLRIGVGRRDNWADLAKILERMTGRPLGKTVMMVPPREPVSCVVKKRQGVQTIFVFHDDRTCSGADYPPGENLLTVMCTFNPEEPKELIITGLPQIRTTQHRARIIRARNSLTIVERPTLFNFDSLAFQVRLTGGDFLVIGPGTQAGRPSSLAHHFLIKRRKGVQFETVLVLIPEVVAVPVQERAAG